MIVQFRRYALALRAVIFVLPYISFTLAGDFNRHLFGVKPAFSSADYLYLALFTTVVWSFVAERQEVTSITKISAENTGLYACFSACSITYVVDLIALFLVRQFDYSRALFLVSAFILFGLSVSVRTAFRILLRQLAVYRPAERVIVVGASRFAARAGAKIQRNEFVRCSVVGHVQLPGETIGVLNAPIFQLTEIESIEKLNIDDVVVAVSPDQYSALRHYIPKFQFLGKPIRIIVDVGAGMKVRNRVLEFGRLQMLDLDPSPTASIGYFLVKRGFDLIFSMTALLITAIPMLIITIIIKLTSPGPILFRQERVGKNGHLFTMYKFRTMQVATTTEGDTRWTAEDDPRRTHFGVLLRKTSLDELPQFFNVLKGEMSVVGPRPERPHFVKKFREDIALYQTRHHLNVGITGWAQVNGLRGDTSIQRRIRYDLYYLQHWSLLFDIRIILMTLWGGFTGKNAY